MVTFVALCLAIAFCTAARTPGADLSETLTSAGRFDQRQPASTDLDWVPAKPLCTSMLLLTPGNSFLFSGSRMISPSVKIGSLNSCHEFQEQVLERVAWGSTTHSLLVSVPWCDTITSLRVGSNPTYPRAYVQRI